MEGRALSQKNAAANGFVAAAGGEEGFPSLLHLLQSQLRWGAIAAVVFKWGITKTIAGRLAPVVLVSTRKSSHFPFPISIIHAIFPYIKWMHPCVAARAYPVGNTTVPLLIEMCIALIYRAVVIIVNSTYTKRVGRFATKATGKAILRSL